MNSSQAEVFQLLAASVNPEAVERKQKRFKPEMEAPPTTDIVYQSVLTLYNNPDTSEKEKASKWLDSLQKSVYSWSIADELLQQKRDLQSCYFAAQTMRNKIQTSFHELPEYSHDSLRDSLMNHVCQITADTEVVIVTQLCLALADLALLMSAWKNPVSELIQKLSVNDNSVYPLVIILTLIPEEMNSRYLRLGANRREDITRQLESNSRVVTEFLSACLQNCDNISLMVLNVIKCFTAWIAVHAIAITDLLNNIIIGKTFSLLSNNDTEIKLHDAAADCLCTLLQCLEGNNNGQVLEVNIFNSVLQLENSYHLAVAHEDLDKAINYCRIFTIMSETFLDKIVGCSNEHTAHFSIKSLDLVLNCVGHYDYEVMEITFHLWYRLSEEIYQKNNDQLTIHFQPYIERLISAMYRHSQMDADHEGLIDESDTFSDFRRKVSDLIKDVVFIVGSCTCFKQMFLTLQEPNATWEHCEAALFIMENVAKNILPDENDVVPKVVEAILNLPENTHIAVRYTSITLLGELCEWIDNHPDTLQAILNFLLYSLQQKNGLAAAAATALASICSKCRDQMVCHLSGLVQIVASLDSFEITNEAAIGVLKGISTIVARLPNDQVTLTLQQICSYQMVPLRALIEADVKVERNKRSDPSFWVDRLTAILRHTDVDVRPSEVHPCLPIINEAWWPILSNILNKYQTDSGIMERTCRSIRYIIRCIGKEGSPLLEPLVKQMVHLYELHQHSCFLYLGSILVDEFCNVNDQCTQGLLNMLQAFIQPTFNILQTENGLKNHPDTVDDFFRLCSRFTQRCAIPFLQSAIVTPVIQCALLACTLDHRDANLSVMKFFYNLLNCGRTDSNDIKRSLVIQLVQANGESLVLNLLHSSVFCLHSYMLSDVADVLLELKAIDEEHTSVYLRNAVDALPKKNSGGCVTATQSQIDSFHATVLKSETSKSLTHALKDFTLLFR